MFDMTVVLDYRGALLHGLDVGRAVHQREFAVAGRLGLSQRHLRQLRGQSLAQTGVLGHGKAVSFGQWQDEVVGVEGLQGGAHGNGRPKDCVRLGYSMGGCAF